MVILTQPNGNSHHIAMLKLIMGPRLNMQPNLNQVRPFMLMA